MMRSVLFMWGAVKEGFGATGIGALGLFLTSFSGMIPDSASGTFGGAEDSNLGLGGTKQAS